MRLDQTVNGYPHIFDNVRHIGTSSDIGRRRPTTGNNNGGQQTGVYAAIAIFGWLSVECLPTSDYVGTSSNESSMVQKVG